MMTVELANLEINLGSLLGALLHVSPDAGRLVYLSPRTGFGRIAMIEGILSATLVKGSEGFNHIRKLLDRAKKLMGKRHTFIHGAWGLPKEDNQGEVRWHDLPFQEDSPSRPVPLSELRDMVEDIRELAEDVRLTTADYYQQWPPYSSKPRRRSPQIREKAASNNPPRGTLPKPKRRPKSSKPTA